MAKFNIYKMRKAQESSLITKLESAGLTLSGQKIIDTFTLSLYISQSPQPIDIWWTDLYSEYIRGIQKPKNKVHFAVFLISSDSLLYSISMGKSHFYLKDFCDIDFGINLAERIADNNNLKLKNSKLFGGKKSKTIVSYQDHSEFEYDSGESIHYVKSKTIDIEKWGEVASFGNSVQLHLNITPDNLPGLILVIEEELQKTPIIILPRATSILDGSKIAELDQTLSQAILDNTNASLQPAEAIVSGVDFIFIDKSQYRLIFDRHRLKFTGELSLESLREFINQQGIVLAENINSIKIKVSDEHNKGYTKPLKYFLDYVDDDRHFLLDGKWHIFNQNYIEYLKRQIDDKIVLEISEINLSKSEFEHWRAELPEGSLAYAEFYFNQLRADDGYLNLDREITILQDQYKIEKLDLYKNETAFFVKIGSPQKMGYAIDQAIATVKILQNQQSSIQINGQDIKPTSICLWLIFDRQTTISKISDIKSLIFLMKLAEWQRQCANANYRPIMRIGYRVD